MKIACLHGVIHTCFIIYFLKSCHPSFILSIWWCKNVGYKWWSCWNGKKIGIGGRLAGNLRIFFRHLALRSLQCLVICLVVARSLQWCQSIWNPGVGFLSSFLLANYSNISLKSWKAHFHDAGLDDSYFMFVPRLVFLQELLLLLP